MNNDDVPVGALVFMVALCAIISGLFWYPIGRGKGREMTQIEAVKEGHGQWVVSPEGVVSFKWRDAK